MNKNEYDMKIEIIRNKIESDTSINGTVKNIVGYTLSQEPETDEERQEIINAVKNQLKMKKIKLPKYDVENMYMVNGLKAEFAKLEELFDNSYYIKNMYTRKGQKLFEKGSEWTQVLFNNCIRNMKNKDFKNPQEKVEDTE